MTQLSKQQNSVGVRVINSLPNTTSKELELYNAYKGAKKIKDFNSKEELALVNALIIRWATYIGIKQPDKTETNVLANFIKDEFPNLSAFDIKEAIDLLVKQELETDANPYGMLSVIYVSKVLKAYQIHRARVVFKVQEKLDKIEQDTVIPPTDAERLQNFKLLLKMAKETASKGENYYDAGDILYYFFWKNNLVTKPMPEELISASLNYGERMFSSKAQNTALKNVINGVGFTKLVRKDIVNRYAREYAVNNWLKNADINTITKKLSIEMIKH